MKNNSSSTGTGWPSTSRGRLTAGACSVIGSDAASIAAEAALDVIYVIRTSLAKAELNAPDTVRAYKGLSTVGWAFRSLKSVDLKVRPVFHRTDERVRAHVLLYMLAYYVAWHMRRRLVSLLFDDEDRAGAGAARVCIVAPARGPLQIRNAPVSGMALYGQSIPAPYDSLDNHFPAPMDAVLSTPAGHQ